MKENKMYSLHKQSCALNFTEYSGNKIQYFETQTFQVSQKERRELSPFDLKLRGGSLVQ